MNLFAFLSGLAGRAIALFTSVDPALRAPVAVSLGAVPGALSRYYLTLLATRWFGPSFPYGTFLINLTGAMVMGFFVTFILERTLASPDLRLLVAVGFLGAYTTFSSYALDTSVLLKSGSYGAAFFYWLGSPVLGLISLELGSFLARRIP